MYVFLEQLVRARVDKKGLSFKQRRSMLTATCDHRGTDRGEVNDVYLIVTSPLSSTEVTFRKVKGPIPFNFPFWGARN